MTGPVARRHPPFDPELAAILTDIRRTVPASLHPEDIPTARARNPQPSVSELITGRHLECSDIRVPGAASVPDVTISVLTRIAHVDPGPAIFYIHGGGMVAGNRFTGITTPLAWVEEFDAVLVSVEYRLAPECPAPAALYDCYAALEWTAAHPSELRFDPDRLLIAGNSAGGGLAAGVALLARDRGGPELAGQCLMYAMLDDRNDTVSSRQFVGEGMGDRITNETYWAAYLGPCRVGRPELPYLAPARADDLSGLPQAYLDCGSAEVVRDENVAYALRLWASGVQAELHVWPGGWHAFDLLAPQALLSGEMVARRTDWVRRTVT